LVGIILVSFFGVISPLVGIILVSFFGVISENKNFFKKRLIFLNRYGILYEKNVNS